MRDQPTTELAQSAAAHSDQRLVKRLRYIAGWCLVRPRRWLFRNMIFSTDLRWRFERMDWGDEGVWLWPNVGWWIGYRTVMPFFRWLNWDAWRYFCDWTGGSRQTYPLIARIIHKIGQTTYGCAAHGGECYHCASDDGDPVDLSSDDTGKTFRLAETWTVGTQNGTDHRFRGTTICPACGYEAEYEDGSL